MSIAAYVASRDFCEATRRALAACGVQLIGTQSVSPDDTLANTTRAYVLNDNGKHRLVPREEVLQIAARKCAKNGGVSA